MSFQALSTTKRELGTRYGEIETDLRNKIQIILQDESVLPITLITALAHESGSTIGEEPTVQELFDYAVELFPKATLYVEVKLLLIRLIVEISSRQRE